VKEINKNITETMLLSYLNESLSQEEQSGVEDWINSSETNNKQFSDLEKIWKHAAVTDNFHSINTANDWQKLKTKIKFEKEEKPNRNIRNLSGLQLFIRIAAIIVLFTGLTYAVFEYNNIFKPGDSELIVSTALNKKYEIILTDGTIVILNKNAQLSYPKQFNDDIRKVKLEGEGYFKVSENKEKPFVVETGNNAIIKVLGTEFNIKNELAQSRVKVNVINGKVAFYESGKESGKVFITKKQQAILTKTGITKSETINTNFLSWKTGILVFENEEIEKVVQELSGFYGKTILIENKENKTYRITSTFDNEELKDVLDEIELILNAEFKYENDTVTLYLE